jgi:2-polyprenyl-3-methyl-5-hydroxy-6-metoxy-1,4-benzoquinol methylase
MAESPVWSEIHAARRAAAARFGPLFRLPVRTRIHREAARVLGHGASVLDVGAGDRRVRDRLAALVPDLRYASLDPDPAGGHDHASLEGAAEAYDAILLLEVLEHLPLGDGLALLRRLHERLRPGGLLVASTPNVAHPWAYLRDATHVTPYAHDELAGVLALAGFEVESLFRLYHAPWLRSVLRRVLAAPVHRLLGVDFAPGVGALARPDNANLCR